MDGSVDTSGRGSKSLPASLSVSKSWELPIGNRGSWHMNIEVPILFPPKVIWGGRFVWYCLILDFGICCWNFLLTHRNLFGTTFSGFPGKKRKNEVSIYLNVYIYLQSPPPDPAQIMHLFLQRTLGVSQGSVASTCHWSMPFDLNRPHLFAKSFYDRRCTTNPGLRFEAPGGSGWATWILENNGNKYGASNVRWLMRITSNHLISKAHLLIQPR